MAYTCQTQSLRIPIQPIRPALLLWIWATMAVIFTLPLTAQAQTPEEDRAAGIAAFQTTLYPLLQTNSCVGCHQVTFPTITHSDINLAYDAVLPNVDLISPEKSLVVEQMTLARHFCGAPADCDNLAVEMRTQIGVWEGLLPQSPISTVLIADPAPGDTPTEPTPVPVEETLEPIVVDANTTTSDPLLESDAATLDLIFAAIQALIVQMTELYNVLFALINSQFETSPTTAVDSEPTDTPIATGTEPEMVPPTEPEPTPEPVAEASPEMLAEAADMQAFSDTVHPLLQTYCASCHGNNGPIAPYMAHSDLATAYHAVVDNQKVNLNVPISSRLVQKLVTELHNCWGGVAGCPDDAETMRIAIATWAAETGANANAGGVEDSIVSNTVTLANAKLTNTNVRYDTNIIARYDFAEGTGTTASDTSGVGTPINLQLSGTEWIEGGGLKIVSGKATSTPDASRKLYDMIAGPQGSDEYTVEAWIVPDNVDQTGPARIFTYSEDTADRNFTMGQRGPIYIYRNRTPDTGIDNGSSPELRALDESLLQTTLQHVVMTFDQTNGRRIYVNGAFTDNIDPAGPGSLINTWNPNYTVVIGNEATNKRLWKGEMHFAAVYNQALTPTQVQQNFNAGADAGQSYLLQFDVATWVGIPNSYIEMEVREFDGFSYLLSNPTFFGEGANNIPLMGMRIAINDTVPVTAQAFANLDTMITGTGQLLSTQGSVIAKELGVEQDGFSLVFDMLGLYQVDIAPNNAPLASVQFSNEQLPDAGMRTFDQINDTMAALTGVDPNSANVKNTFNEIKQQLPSSFDLRTFVSAQQVGMVKLAGEYCKAMIGSNPLRNAFFAPEVGTFDVNSNFFNNQGQTDAILSKLVTRMYGTAILNQPSINQTLAILNPLVAQLSATSGHRVALEGTCTAVLSSAGVLIY